MEKKYWKGIEELQNDPEFSRLKDNEFYELLPLRESDQQPDPTHRRDFLKYLGFGIAAASLAACTAPVKKAIPYLVKPEEITPGIPNYYASTFFDGHDYASVVVKTREGRPIKVESNELSKFGASGTNARTQASILGLYDNGRLQTPTVNKKVSEWSAIDSAIKQKLAEISGKQGKIRILSSTIISPTTKKAIADFTAKYPTTKHVQYDAISYSGMIKANQLSFGKAIIPSYRFDNASVIVGFECDFAGNWIAPAEYSRQYAVTRKLAKEKKSMSRHIQFEANMTMTGSCADNRYKLRPSEHGAALVSLYNMLAGVAGASTTNGNNPPTGGDEALHKTATELWNNKGKALVVSGSNDVNDQVIVNAINTLLGSYDSTIDLDRACNLRQGNDEEMMELLREINANEVGALIIYNSNPAYTLPDGAGFAKALSKIELTVSLADREDETAKHCTYNCPDHHYLESWNDAEPVKGIYSTSQPTIQSLFNTRQAQQSLLMWAEAPVTDYHEYLRANWKQRTGGTDAGWMKALQDGVSDGPSVEKTTSSFAGNVNDAASKIAGRKASGIDVVVYESAAMGNGVQCNNPWLLELPDPVSRICWDNYLSVSMAFAKAQGYKQGNVIEIKSGNVSVKGPVLIQPGMADQTVAIAAGYGRTGAGKAGNGVGVNAYPLTSLVNGSIQYFSTGASLNKTVDDDHKLTGTQTHHTLMGRNHDIVKETTLSAWQKDAKAGNEVEMFTTYKGKQPAKDVDLWATPELPGFEKPNHLWGMIIDLNSCVGCGSCVVACTAENNVPVVGKDEISRSREMHWIRIDRYYSSDADPVEHGKKDYDKMEEPSDNPQVVFQPMMCQHCNHAPCETVCPVAATPHSSEGLNMMAYNRCVGTRYCANNCPYKVRRFNWFKYSDNEQFDYNMNNPVGKMVLNPDVVVRSRGVMEKCSLCVQRIQYGKLEAKKNGRKVKEGEIKTACAQACPTNAITFGDYNASGSGFTKMAEDERNYTVLEPLNTQPNIRYQVKVRNVEAKAGHHG